jgi:hypothetical protein
VGGEITREIDGRRFAGGASSCAVTPRGTEHAYQNFQDQTAHLLVMVTPAGLDRFFEEVTELSDGSSRPDLSRVEQLMQDYGMEFLGPPLSVPQ